MWGQICQWVKVEHPSPTHKVNLSKGLNSERKVGQQIGQVVPGF